MPLSDILTSPLYRVLIEGTHLFLSIYLFLIIIRVLMSWFSRGNGPLTSYIIATTEPYLGFFRRLPLRMGMLDLSPMVAIFLLDILRMLLSQHLASL